MPLVTDKEIEVFATEALKQTGRPFKVKVVVTFEPSAPRWLWQFGHEFLDKCIEDAAKRAKMHLRSNYGPTSIDYTLMREMTSQAGSVEDDSRNPSLKNPPPGWQLFSRHIRSMGDVPFIFRERWVHPDSLSGLYFDATPEKYDVELYPSVIDPKTFKTLAEGAFISPNEIETPVSERFLPHENRQSYKRALAMLQTLMQKQVGQKVSKPLRAKMVPAKDFFRKQKGALPSR